MLHGNENSCMTSSRQKEFTGLVSEDSAGQSASVLHQPLNTHDLAVVLSRHNTIEALDLQIHQRLSN